MQAVVQVEEEDLVSMQLMAALHRDIEFLMGVTEYRITDTRTIIELEMIHERFSVNHSHHFLVL